jgi:hypothetical protein
MPSKNKNYKTVGTQYQCVRCDRLFDSRSEVATHSLDERRKDGTLSDYDRHFLRECGRDSRICRYHHPEREIGGVSPTETSASLKADLDRLREKARDARAELESGTLDREEIGRAKKRLAVAERRALVAFFQLILPREGRYRNKFSAAHLAQLEKIQPGGLVGVIKKRLEKRVKRLLPNDGTQTPYVAHAVDVASHTVAVCCRGCIERWHAIPKDSGDLSEAQLDRLSGEVRTYLGEMIVPRGPVRDWMTELPKAHPLDKFYLEGDYVVSEENGKWNVERVGEGYQGPRTEFKRSRK